MKNTKKWNKESFYSIGALILAYICIEPLSNLLFKIYDSNQIILNKFDIFIFTSFKGKVFIRSLDIIYWIPFIASLMLLALALFWGIKSIKKTSGGAEKGRMLGIVSTTITAFVWVLIVIFNIFPLN